MSDRRHQERPETSERRSFPRPPLWLNLLLIVLGIGGVIFARTRRERVETEFKHVIQEEQRTPDDVKKLKEQLAEMGLTRDALQRELESRKKMIANLKAEDFYLSIDTAKKKWRFNYGDTTLRDGDLTVGDSKTITGNGKSWTFVPLKGAFGVEAKYVDYAWEVPDWVYAMNGQPAPATSPTLTGGLGKYVVFLPNGYVIHSPPDASSPLKTAKPGSFMMSDADLRAIWPRLHKGTPVYIY
ncbi:MAG TPA: hypothetical protein VFN10_02665 [Thermoanaerobaculia bacterium]|nr:hypothetical protein [Thermoanaerobaculia bacterium]